MADNRASARLKTSPLAARPSLISFGILAHGGVGTPKTYGQGCRNACRAGSGMLEHGAHSLEAVVEAVRILEDDGRFNAGKGSVLRLDGRTVEMDAAVMDSDGRIGGVIAIRDVRNPVVVARRVVETPHVALAGEGATLFARHLGLPQSEGVSPTALRRYRRFRTLAGDDRLGQQDGRWDGQDLRSLWNFSLPYYDAFPVDTVGAVAVDRHGKFAAAVSTGGASPMLLGRVGDVPFVGCGFYAGQLAAIAVTGIGEEIVKRMLSKTIYDRIAAGISLRQACQEGLDLFPQTVPIGIVAITALETLSLANRKMPTARLVFRSTSGHQRRC